MVFSIRNTASVRCSVSVRFSVIGGSTVDDRTRLSLVPGPRGKGLVTIERFLGCAESAVLDLGKSQLQGLNYSRDLSVALYKISLRIHNRRSCTSYLRRIYAP